MKREDKDTQHLNVHLAVENFGPIEKAEIDLRPLTVFVGESNTGKTYLAALIYALHPAFEGSAKWLYTEDESDLKFAQRFSRELKKCFNLKSVSELKRTRSDPGDELRVTLRVYENGVLPLQIDWKYDSRHTGSLSENNKVSKENLEIKESDRLWNNGTQKTPAVHYLPAARRGIMYSYEAFDNLHVADKSDIGSHSYSTFSGWISDFLKQIINYNKHYNSSEGIIEIAKSLETEVLRGQIEVNRPAGAGFPEVLYRPQNAEQTLRMSQSSSMVSELAPLVLYLRGIVNPGDTLIIEEPESHLHPRAQTQIAITLARLVRAGVRVIITTHSDWLLEQIGNLVREGEVMKLENNQSEPTTWLTMEEVGAWRFQTDKPVEEIKFDLIEGIEPLDYGKVAEELYNRSVDLRTSLREKMGDNTSEQE